MNHLHDVRNIMKAHQVDALIIPMADRFQSEYVPTHDRWLEWLTGFTGSAGSAVLMLDKAAFFTDGRYTLQAQQQVDSTAFTLLDSTTPMLQWLEQHLQPGMLVGADSWLITQQFFTRMQPMLTANKCSFRSTAGLLEPLWHPRPNANQRPAFLYDTTYAGQPWQEKIQWLRTWLTEQKQEAIFLAAPECVNWLLNIRGYDLPHTPFQLCYALVSHSQVDVFTDLHTLTPEMHHHFGNDVVWHGLEIVEATLCGAAYKSINYDATLTPARAVECLSTPGRKLTATPCPVIQKKAAKNTVEQQGMRAAHLRDGAALCEFLCWLNHAFTHSEKLDEISIAEKLASFRAQQELFHSLSFDTIAGMNAHGAIVHYHATPESTAPITNGILLLDSGGQYLDGTTDVTRTLALGTPTPQQKEHFTRVLKGHIRLAMATFPQGISGVHLDVLARQYLWQTGLDFDHGTGHGVGSFMNVHEGPQNISKALRDAPLRAGMVISNEPGVYITGEYGIRIESLVMVVAQPELAATQGRNMLGFETLTLVPIDSTLVDTNLLEDDEKDWLNHYHAHVRAALLPLVSPPTQAWLIQATAPL